MEMLYRRLGRSGLKLSGLSLGSWLTYGGPVNAESTRACLAAAYQAGVNFFDCAESYSGGQAEEVLGRSLKELAWPRSGYVVSSKAFWGGERAYEVGTNRKRLTEACHNALRRMQVDHLDLFFCHRPDPETPLEETVRAMSDLVNQGKVLYWGTSVWPAADIAEACRIADAGGWHRPQMEQPQYNMFFRDGVERDLAWTCRREGLGLTTWSPLMSGLLSGKYNDGIPPGSRATQPGMEWLADRLTDDAAKLRIAKVRELHEVARELGATTAQLAIAWCLRTPAVTTVITGASRLEQLEENLGALDVLPRLTPAVLARIDAILA